MKRIITFFVGPRRAGNSSAKFSATVRSSPKWNTGAGKSAMKEKNDMTDITRKRFNEMAKAGRKQADDAFDASRRRNEIIRKQIESQNKAPRDRAERLRKQTEDMNRNRRNQRGF